MKFLLYLIFLLVGLNLLGTIYSAFIPPYQNLTWGVSFSPRYSLDLGLDPKVTFQDILTNLGAKNIRLSAYWDEIEPFDSAQGKPFEFQNLDYYVNQAAKYQAKVILVVGHKIPRWPECYYPVWLEAGNNSHRQERQLRMLDQVITHFDKFENVVAFQIENEPLLPFGNCQLDSREFIKKEVEQARAKTQKLIILSDSGELRPWITPMKLSDVFGTTLYRTIRIAGNLELTYPLPPTFYSLKSYLIRTFFAPLNQKTIIIELQAEPWLAKDIKEIKLEEQTQAFGLEKFQDNVQFARKTGFSEIYLWGVEWWYYMRQNDHPEYLEYAKSLF